MDARQQLLATPTSAQAYAELGHTLHQRVEYEAAIRCYKAGLSIDGDCDKLHCLMGLTYHNLGNHPLAIKHYSRAADLNPANADAHYYLGFILIQEGRVNEAIENLRQSLKLKADLNPAYYYLGIALERLGRHDEARSLLTQRLQETATQPSPDVVFTLGELLSERRRYTTQRCHTQALVNSLLLTLKKQSLHVFGDSHRSVFNNLANVSCYNVGAGTAYNLVATTSSTGAGNKILAITNELDAESDCIVLVFGEIDCMEHLLKNHFRTGSNPDALLDILIGRYMSFVSLLTEAGFRVLIYGPAFSGLALNSHGGLRERNWMVKRFNQKLSEACQEHTNILFASLDWLLVGADMTPMLELSEDGRHLDAFPQGSKVLQAVVLAKFLEAAQAQVMGSETTWLDLNTANHVLEKPYILIEDRNEHYGQTSLSTNASRITKPSLTTGITTASDRYRLPIGPGSISSLILDLLDHVRIDSLRLRLSTEHRDEIISGELQIFSMDQKQLRLIGQRTLTNVQTASIGMTLTGTLARGLILRVQGVRDDHPDHVASLVVHELCVESSPEHETLSSAGGPL